MPSYAAIFKGEHKGDRKSIQPMNRRSEDESEPSSKAFLSVTSIFILAVHGALLDEAQMRIVADPIPFHTWGSRGLLQKYIAMCLFACAGYAIIDLQLVLMVHVCVCTCMHMYIIYIYIHILCISWVCDTLITLCLCYVASLHLFSSLPSLCRLGF